LILVQTYIEHPEHVVFVILSMFTSLISLAQMLKLHCSLVQLPAGGKDVMQPMQSTHTHILLFGSNFYILAMYVQMLDIY